MHDSPAYVATMVTLVFLFYPALFALGLGALWLVVAVVASAIRFGQPKPRDFSDLPPGDLPGLLPEPLVGGGHATHREPEADAGPDTSLQEAARNRGRRVLHRRDAPGGGLALGDQAGGLLLAAGGGGAGAGGGGGELTNLTDGRADHLLD